MGEKVSLIDLSRPGNPTDKAILTGYPDTCPICHHGIAAVWINGVRQDGGKTVEAVYRCPRRECQSLFIGYYEEHPKKAVYVLIASAPTRPKAHEFNQTIQDISEAFVTIYNQAARAEQLDLREVAGVGYRKALEFLVKDYLIDTYPNDADKITGKFLGACIKDHIEDAALRNCAKLASWLGNDETHYERRWDKDINDLKQLIDLTVHSIAAARMRKAYEREMLAEEKDEGGEN